MRCRVDVLALVAMIMLFGGDGVTAQSMPDSDNGRYTMSAVKDGVLRLDTRTGALSTCTDSGSGWACRVVPDERVALDAEIGRLQRDNESLKVQLAQAKAAEALAKQDRPQPNGADGERKIEIPLPSDRDIERMTSLIEQAWRRLVDLASRIQRDPPGRI